MLVMGSQLVRTSHHSVEKWDELVNPLVSYLADVIGKGSRPLQLQVTCGSGMMQQSRVAAHRL
jgi:hypothetical protein